MNPIPELKQRARKEPAVKTIAILLLAWGALIILDAFVAGFRRADTALLATLAMRLILVLGFLGSLRFYLLGDLAKGYRGFKAFTGYALFFSYLAAAIAPTAWLEAGLIGKPLAWISWIAALAACAPGLALYILLCTNSFRVKLGVMSAKEVEKKAKYRPAKPKTLLGKILDNGDAVVQAIIMVAIIHASLFQLYVIPTGSMIPKFLVGDRVIVSKAQSGPKVPLSPLKLPTVSAPKRGDIIVFDNPFSEKPPVIRRMLNTLVFYVSLSTVNMDKEGGTDRVGTVVKRLVGMPGEKLMMLDDVLYMKKEGGDWAALDEAGYAYTFANESPATLKKILPDDRLSKESKLFYEKLDQWRKDTSVGSQAEALLAAAAPFRSLRSSALMASLGPAARKYLAAAGTECFDRFGAESEAEGIESVFRKRAMNYEERFVLQTYPDVPLFLWAVSDQSRLDAFNRFLAAPSYGSLDRYAEAAAVLNLRVKELMARRFSVYLRLLKADDTARLARMAQQDGTVFGEDQTLLGKEWPELQRYLAIFDSRAFPAFPAGEGEYLAPDRYFLMGDNRYNSLDFRFSHGPSAIPASQEYGSSPNYSYRALDSNDPYSIEYVSSISLHSLPLDRILGKVLLTFWPPK